jgi:hypothetical protein
MCALHPHSKYVFEAILRETYLSEGKIDGCRAATDSKGDESWDQSKVTGITLSPGRGKGYNF